MNTLYKILLTKSISKKAIKGDKSNIEFLPKEDLSSNALIGLRIGSVTWCKSTTKGLSLDILGIHDKTALMINAHFITSSSIFNASISVTI
jgi:hypothetical protein